MRVDWLAPAVEVPGNGEVVALVAIAAIGDHEVLDGIVRGHRRPGEEVIDQRTCCFTAALQ